MMSRARAVGAASGGGIDIPLMGLIEEDGELRRLSALWQGEEAAKGRSMQAQAARYDGAQYAKAGALRAGSTFLAGTANLVNNLPMAGQGQSFMEKYG